MKKFLILFISILCCCYVKAQSNTEVLYFQSDIAAFKRDNPPVDGKVIVGYRFAVCKITNGKLESSCHSGDIDKFTKEIKNNPGRVFGGTFTVRTSNLSRFSNEKWTVYEQHFNTESVPPSFDGAYGYYQSEHTRYVAIKKDCSELKIWSEPTFVNREPGDKSTFIYGTLQVFKRVTIDELNRTNNQRAFLD